MNEKILIERGFENLIDTLAHLASVNIQNKYIVNGTVNEYIVPDDLLEDLSSEIEFFEFQKFPTRLQSLKSKLGDKGYRKLIKLREFIIENNSFLEKYTNSNLKELIQNDAIWKNIQKLASSILNNISFNLSDWESQYA